MHVQEKQLNNTIQKTKTVFFPKKEFLLNTCASFRYKMELCVRRAMVNFLLAFYPALLVRKVFPWRRLGIGARIN